MVTNEFGSVYSFVCFVLGWGQKVIKLFPDSPRIWALAKLYLETSKGEEHQLCYEAARLRVKMRLTGKLHLDGRTCEWTTNTQHGSHPLNFPEWVILGTGCVPGGTLEAMPETRYKSQWHLWSVTLVSQEGSHTCLMWTASPCPSAVSPGEKIPLGQLCKLQCDLMQGHPQKNA